METPTYASARIWRQALGVLVLLLVTALLYAPGLQGPFLLDDVGSVNVLTVRDFSLGPLWYDLTHNTSGLLGRPVSVLSLAFSRILYATDPWGFKYHNLLLHLFNAVLLFCLFLKLLPRLVPKIREEQVYLVALLVMGLWLMHPLFVSTVLYVVQRMAQLATLFSLAALLAWVRWREEITATTLRFALNLALFLVLLLLAVLSKENGALVVFYVLLIEFLCFGFVAESTTVRRRLWGFMALFVAAPIAVGVAYLLTHPDQFINYSIRNYDMVERLLTQLHVVLFYVKLVLLPVVSDMSLFHDSWQPVRSLDFVTVLLFLFWLLAATSVILLRKRAPVVAFGIGWFLVSHLMESTFLALELVFEHRNYLAAAGLLLIPVYCLVTLAEKRLVAVLATAFSLLLAFMTHVRVSEWQSAELIFTLAVQDHPESIRARVGYSGWMYNLGNTEEALKHIDVAIALDPEDYSTVIIKMLFLCGRGEEEQMNALFEEGMHRAKLYPATPGSVSTMDLLMAEIQRGNCKELASTRILDWLNVAREQEDNRGNRVFTGYMQRQQGFFYYILQDPVRGYEHMVAAFENTGMASILGEVIDIEIQLGALETAEHLLGILEELNRERLGTETPLLERRRKQYEAAVAERAAQQEAALLEPLPEGAPDA